MPLAERRTTDECYGVYSSKRKAHNALVRLASEKRLCNALLGIGEGPVTPCGGCALNERLNCASKTGRLRQFTKAVVALAPLRLNKWPYAGPIGVRERGDLHILEDWRYLGTAQSEQDIYPILETRREAFDQDMFAFLSRTLPRVPKKRIVPISCRPESHSVQTFDLG